MDNPIAAPSPTKRSRLAGLDRAYGRRGNPLPPLAPHPGARIPAAGQRVLINGDTYDIIFDAVGKSSFARCEGSLKERGIYLAPTGGLGNYALAVWTRRRGGKRVMCGMSMEKTESLRFIGELIETGRIRPVIDRRYPLEQMAEAHRYVEQGHKKGNVVITVIGREGNLK